MEWPTLNHVFYIPLILAIGALLGYWGGRRALRAEIADSEDAMRERERRREERLARIQQREEAQKGATSAPDAD